MGGPGLSQGYWSKDTGVGINVELASAPQITAGLKVPHLVLEMLKESCGHVSHIHHRVRAVRTGNESLLSHSSASRRRIQQAGH